MLSACELDLVPQADLSDGVFWQTDQDFRQATNYLYKISETENRTETNMMLHPQFRDVMSDNAVSGGTYGRSPISNGSYLPSSDFGPWNKDYAIIRAANNIIEHAAGFVSTSVPRYIGEAKFFRAYAYADLVSRYGDVPLILRTLDTDNEELYAPRTPREQVIAAIYQDLDDAAAGLPANSQLNMATEYGMVTKGAALALKSRVALREGTWNKFHKNADFNTHLQTAKEAALAVMNSNEYVLFNQFGLESYKQLFKMAGEGPANTEAIWVFQYGVNYENSVLQSPYASPAVEGSIGITKSLVEDFLCTDGLPIGKSPLYKGKTNTLSEFENRDPRLNGTVVKKGDSYTYGTPYIPSLRSITGYTIYKYFDVVAPDYFNRFIDMMIIRYGEVLLNYAEATYELNNTISDNDLNISVNRLRDRVGMPHLTNGFVTANSLNMREEIRRERRVELGMEGFRYDDLLRWKTAEVELPKPLLGVRVFKAEYPGINPSTLTMTTDSIIIAEQADKRDFDPAKNYLWPLPLNQTALNPNLAQNPNW
jgi:hypothetical protein